MSKSHQSRRIEVRVPSRDFSAGVETALERLGYELVPAHAGTADPDARIVAAGRLKRRGGKGTAPIILFGDPKSQDASNPRVIGVLKQPAKLLDLYGLLQNALEAYPRAVPRISTSLPARSLCSGVYVPGAILNLSERGCRLRSTKNLPGDESIRLQFTLPNLGLIDIRADPRHRVGEEAGLAFEEIPEAPRTAIANFVTTSLTRAL